MEIGLAFAGLVMVLFDFEFYGVFLAMSPYLFRMRETDNTVFLAINQHDARLDLSRSSRDIQFERIQILILFLHLLFDRLDDKIEHDLRDAGRLGSNLHGGSLERTERAIEDDALYFLVHVAGLAEDDRCAAH